MVYIKSHKYFIKMKNDMVFITLVLLFLLYYHNSAFLSIFEKEDICYIINTVKNKLYLYILYLTECTINRGIK